MPDASPPRDPAFATIHAYAKRFLMPCFDAIGDTVGVVVRRISALERREAMRNAARATLQEAGHEPTLQEVERMVDEFVKRRFTATRAAAEPPLSLPELGPGWTFVRPDGTEVALGRSVDDDEHAWLDSPR